MMTEITHKNDVLAEARDEIAALCLPLAETDTDYDWGMKVGAYTCLAILDRHLAPARAALMAHTARGE